MGTRIVLCALLCAVAWGQQDRKLTPREMFYSAPPAAAAADNHSSPVSPPAKPAAKRPDPKRTLAPVGDVKAAAATNSTPSTPVEPAGRQEVPLVNAALQSYAPLGVRYSVLKLNASGDEEVDSDAVFHSGDRIRLSVEVNDAGYLYIVNRGSSGVWKVLFPSAETAGGDNRVDRGRRYQIPSQFTFTFDEQPGKETLFLIVARQPERDLDSLIYSLGHAAPVKDRKPAATMLLAQNVVIGDPLVGRLRNTYARDLLIEKVSDGAAAAAAAKPEKAVYAVNPSRAPDSRVVADIVLRHE